MTETIAFRSPNRFPGTAEILEGIDLSGKTALVTGGSGGLGLTTSAALARAGANVIIASRPGAKLDAAVETVRSATSGSVEGAGVDLGDLASVDALADRLVADDVPIDFLVNNAGVIGGRALSSIGVEMGFMTNVVGHAVLASRIAPLLADGARIACVSSFGHHYSPIVFGDINFENRPYSAWKSYGQSKTGTCLMAVKLNAALRHRGIDAFSLHPGQVITDMGRSMVEEDFAEQVAKTGEIPAEDFMTPDQGAATTIWALTEPRLAGKGGAYLQDCAVAAVRDEPDYRTGVMRYAIDPSSAERLWGTAAKLCGRALPLA
ncbi:NAD(P)-dependent dehydrogenase, short-chain alcohol dehydrogenase family [Sphingopyxis sp. YR583]|uniref:SDR family NAD(P)-dependent oxidoreductase n=1 Tax=Sphingopyxis sp. YR583 TaxID=1881047 RepID=UPI0008A7BAC0|nr:SDR family NAD(P)-dependent oxidoreductase [Sphingopyxis sp. YR583]SEH19244.1 NAD(P)-dependent dehydrogenase, short-chain alcohol dehydrogenase family [Sphingopyxis sp. YR583]